MRLAPIQDLNPEVHKKEKQSSATTLITLCLLMVDTMWPAVSFIPLFSDGRYNVTSCLHLTSHAFLTMMDSSLTSLSKISLSFIKFVMFFVTVMKVTNSSWHQITLIHHDNTVYWVGLLSQGVHLQLFMTVLTHSSSVNYFQSKHQQTDDQMG